jgi:putative restriction endonuclease
MRHWWVNQNQTYTTEVRGNFMWSPKANANGARNPFYDFMLKVAPGDLVFSFCDTRIRALGVVTGPAQTAPKPDFGAAGGNWSSEGWYVPVYYCALSEPIRPKDHIDILRPFLPDRYSPLQLSGDGLQGVYLTFVPDPLATALIALMKRQYFEALAVVSEFPNAPDVEDVDDIPLGPGMGPTFKEQLIKARRGQGVFRSNVLLTEESCRVTGVTDSKHLRASHIKPWKAANDSERLSGFNGLLLSPHIDHLFDKGYISFSNNQELLVVPDVKADLLEKWGIDAGARVGDFNQEQQSFLEFHRIEVFKGRWP